MSTTGAEARGRVGAGDGGDVDVAGGGDVDGRELSPGEATVAAVPDRRGDRAAASSAGRASNRATTSRGPERGCLALVREKYGGAIDERFGPDAGGRASAE